jgi:uncharacterized damage-inducible protein DinB
MNERERIQDQIRRSLDGEAWHGPPVMKVLAGVDAGMAAARPIPGAHTIWELVLHMSAWAGVVLSHLRGERRTLSDEEDWPAPAGDAQAWLADVCRLEQIHRAVIEALSTLEDAQLDAPVAPGLSLYVLLHGLVHHDLYHAGQIALLAKGS